MSVRVLAPAPPRRPFRAAIVTLVACLGTFVFSPPTPAEQLSTFSVHDPSRMVFDAESNRWVIFFTGNGVPFATSTDKVNWTRTSLDTVFKAPPESATNYWAPDIWGTPIHGKWYLFYSLSTFGSQNSTIRVASTPSLSSPVWTFEGIAVSSSAAGGYPYNAIDPAPYYDEQEDRLWLVWGSFWNGMYIVELDPRNPTQTPLGRPVAISDAIYLAGGRPGPNAIEAPYIFRRGDWFYLVNSVDTCCQGSASTYKHVIGRSRSITGPYVDRDGVDLRSYGGTVFTAGGDGEIGPGHFALYTLNGVDRFTYHFYENTSGGASRLGGRAIDWDADGWPLAVHPGPAPRGIYRIRRQNTDLYLHARNEATDPAGGMPVEGPAVMFEAESGSRGAEFAVGSDGSSTYIFPTTPGTGSNPGSSARVVTYTVTFPSAGMYDLYARVRIGPDAGSDDSFFHGNGFGNKSVTTNAQWVTINDLHTGGFTEPGDTAAGRGTAGLEVWKWVNVSKWTNGMSFNVPVTGLTQTFQVGAREDGIRIDAFAFGASGYLFSVADLDAGSSGTLPPPPHARVEQDVLGTRRSQNWLLVPHTSPGGDTYYNIRNAGTRLWLTLASGPDDNRAVSTAGTDFVRLDHAGDLARNEHQKWRVIANTDGSRSIQSYRSGLTLGLPDASTAPGVVLVQKPWIFANQVLMRFLLEPVTDTAAPVLTLPGTVVREAAGPDGAVVSFSASAEDDISGSLPVEYSHAPGSLFPLGRTRITVTATDDAGNTATASFDVVVADTRPPVITVPPDVTLEATSPSGAAATFSASAHDVVSGGVEVSLSPASGSTFPLGTTVVEATAVDHAGNIGRATFRVIVRDTRAPAIVSLTATPNRLWEPNHKMVAVTLTASVADAADAAPVTRVVEVTSTEPEVGLFDGDIGPDWQITGGMTVSLRAERADTESGRAYTITIECTDASGNASRRTVTVIVPRDIKSVDIP